jgi:hypothetical protein
MAPSIWSLLTFRSINIGISRKGDGTFQAPVGYGSVFFPQFIALGDFNGDGKIDVALTNRSAVYILAGNGNGTFKLKLAPRPEAILTRLWPPTSTATAFSILQRPTESGNSVTILLGKADGTFRAPATDPCGVMPYSLAVGDLNGDGKLDLLASDGGGDISLLFGNCRAASGRPYATILVISRTPARLRTSMVTASQISSR